MSSISFAETPDKRKFPSTSVTVPFIFVSSFGITTAPGSGSPLSSFTEPRTVTVCLLSGISVAFFSKNKTMVLPVCLKLRSVPWRINCKVAATVRSSSCRSIRCASLTGSPGKTNWNPVFSSSASNALKSFSCLNPSVTVLVWILSSDCA